MTENTAPDAAGTTTPEMPAGDTRVEFLDEGPCRKRLKFEVPAEQVEEELDQNYRQLRNTIQMPGFRKGKVPISVLRGRFGKKIEAEVQEEMISSTFFDEIEKRELKVLGAPSFENIEFAPGAPLVYEAAVEVTPEFEVPEYQGLTVDALAVEVTPEDVDREVQSLLEQHVSLEPVTTGEQKDEDLAVCHLEMLDPDGKSIFERPEVYLKIGLDSVDNIEVPGLGDKLKGAEADTTLEFSVEVPEDFPLEEVRGQSATLKIGFHEAKRRVVPELDAEMLGRLGLDSEDALRQEIEKNLEMRRRVQEENRQEEILVEKLLEGISMEFPPSVLERRKEEISMGRRFRLMRDGKSQEEVEAALTGDEASIEEEACEELKGIFILDEIADRETVLVTEDEIRNRIQAIAMTSRRDPQEVAEEYSQGGMLAELRSSMRREKVRTVLRKKAKITPADGEAAETSASEGDGSGESE